MDKGRGGGVAECLKVQLWKENKPEDPRFTPRAPELGNLVKIQVMLRVWARFKSSNDLSLPPNLRCLDGGATKRSSYKKSVDDLKFSLMTTARGYLKAKQCL